MKSNSKKAESLGTVCTRASLKNKKAGITLVSLVVTIIILLILAGISISLIAGGDGILGRASGALDANDQATATEKIEMKITYFNVTSYGENTRKANLQELAEGMFQDKEIEYVKIKGNKVASLDKIDAAGEKSIFVKLKEYPYEFEIGSDLQLASVDGVKLSTSDTSNDELRTTIQELKEEIQALKNTSHNYCTTPAGTTSTASNSKPCVIIENYRNGTDWYRIWSDGWIEQGGYSTAANSANGSQINLLKEFSDTTYTLVTSDIIRTRSDAAAYVFQIVQKNTNNFFASGSWTNYNSMNYTEVPFNWYACGY